MFVPMQTPIKYGWRLITFLLAALASAPAAELVPFRSSGWKYVLGTQEASNPTDVWRALSFDDSAWLPAGNTASAPIGYPSDGATGLEGTIQTTIPTGTAGGYTCVFLRKKFNVSNPLEIVGLTLQAQHDDGVAVWLNGTFIGSANVSEPYSISTLASDHEVTVGELSVTPSAGLLVSGENVLAVQVFNATAGSSDLFVDVRLTSVDDEAPAIFSIDPPASGIVQALTFINVAFTENVTGVNASDLLINSVAATSIVTNNPRDYTFTFPQPATGAVTVAWIASPGINDTDGLPTAFVPGASWSYTLDPNILASEAIISEFMADNENLVYNGRDVEDEDGSRSDWLELYNPGLVEVSLNGWYLTDVATNLTKWRIPNVVLSPNKYLLIWASEKNRTNSSKPLHTNFRLSRNAGSYLALVKPDGVTVVSAFSGSTYPPQQTDISYGRDRLDPGLTGYFVLPTPGAQNQTSGTGFAAVPTASHESGVYTNASISFVITPPPGTIVRYTTDGSTPTTSSTQYSGPIVVSNNSTYKFRAFSSTPGIFPSPVQARNFLFLDNTTRDFNSNIPVLVISTEGRAMVQGVPSGFPRTKGTFVVFDAFRGRSSFNRKPDYIGPADFEVFGQTSAGFAKQPYNVELQDAAGNDKRESILGLPAEADWKLRNPFADKCLMNDFLAYELFEKMGNYSCRRRFVEVFVDTGGGRLSYPGDYIGVEVFLEKIERGNDRVDIAEMTPAHTTEPEITGGWMFKDDKDSPGDINIGVNTGGNIANTLKIHEPKPQSLRNVPASAITTYVSNNSSITNYTPAATNQLNYLLRYLAAVNTSLNGAGFELRTGTNHYSYYLDVDTFVDQHWIVEFPKQIDGYRISNFFSKDRGGKIRNVPIWDWNLSFGNADYLQGGLTNGWYYTQTGGADHTFLRSLLGGSALPAAGGDPDFIQKVIDRWGVLRTNVFHPDQVLGRIDEIATLLKDNDAPASPVTRNFAKHNNLNTYLWPNPVGPPAWHVDYTQPTYDLIISEMKNWTKGRFLWIDEQFPKAPTLGIPEGDITAGSPLVLAAPTGTIYYTLDGSDPRATQANGAVAAGAQTYTGSIILNDNARVFARARVGATWSPPSIATYVVRRPRLVITEIMYHPLPPPLGSTNSDEDFEYVELRNVGTTPLAIGGYTISGGIDFTFPARTLAVGERVLVVNNQAAFLSRYPGLNASIAGEFTGNLANNGNRLVLRGRLREGLLDFSYDDAWHPITDGFGFSLVIIDDTAAANTWGLASSWRPSTALNGTPGQGDAAAPGIPRVVINEALTHSDPPPPTDTIELLNLSGAPASVAGWYLTDDFREPKKFRIPLNTPAIPADGFLTFNESDFNVGSTSFSLSSSGDEVYLFSADAGGELTGYVHGFAFGPQLTGVTFGRHVTSSGLDRFVAQASATLGAANSGLKIGPIVISEIMYHPPDVAANGAYWNNSEDEYVELKNVTGFPVNLYHATHTTNTWKLDNAVEFSFPPGTAIAANGYALVVNFNPATDPAQLAAFRAKYGVSAGTPIFGPYQGDLSNGDETVALYLPDTPETSGANAGEVPYVLVDEVHYSDQAPWPGTPDGYGQSLHRVSLNAYADDPVNWVAGGPTAGADYVGGPSPVITANPDNQTVQDSGTATATFSAAAIGQGPLRYQWLFNGSILNGATNSTLVVQNVKPTQAGQYQCYVLNPFGSALSGAGTLTVLILPKIVQSPVDQRVNEGASATFSVIATSLAPPLRYQWFRNGEAVAGATNFFLTLNNVVSDVDDGNYSVVLQDNNGAVASPAGRLTVLLLTQLINPAPRLSLTAVPGQTLTLGTQLRGTKPIWLQWRKFSTNGVNQGLLKAGFINTNQDFLIIPNITNGSAGFYTLQFTNIVGGNLGNTSIRTNAILTVLLDSNANGIPDNWESDYFGSPTGADRDVDSDGDGMSNWSEYIAGTIPTNAASYLKVDGVSATGSAQVIFQAVAGRTYTIEYTDDLTTAVWTRLGDVVPQPVNWTATVTDPAARPDRYYRILTPRRQ